MRYGDTLSPEGQALPKATLIMTNPPFGTKKGGGLPTRTDFTFPPQQAIRLSPAYLPGAAAQRAGGRGAARQRALRGERRPPDLGQSLWTSAICARSCGCPRASFTPRGLRQISSSSPGGRQQGEREKVWVSDLRANMPAFGKRTRVDPRPLWRLRGCLRGRPLGPPGHPGSAGGHGRAGAFSPLFAHLERSGATAWTSVGSRTRARATARPCPSRPCWLKRRWGSWWPRWRSCAGFWRSWGSGS